MKINIVNKSEFDLPKYETHGSVGMDLRADLGNYNNNLEIRMEDYVKIDDSEGLWLVPRQQYMIPTGIFISLPKPMIESHSGEGWGYEAQIRPRSGMAAKYGITVVNAPGTIDSDYRGEIKVILMNLTRVPFKIKHGDRIAQMVINRFERIVWNEIDDLDETDRGEGGFGSTGK